MRKKKWALIVLGVLLVFGWYKLYYKSWDNEGVPENADCIIALDVKRITNTLIWNFITTPSQWKSSNWFSSDEEGKVSWDDMISLPDYVFIFHMPGEPDNAFYTVVEINDKGDFEKGLKQYGFEKTAAGSFISRQTGIEFIQHGNKLLVGNATIADKAYIQQVAATLFTKKQQINKSSLEKTINEKSHVVLNSTFINHTPVLLRGNFDKESFIFSIPLPVEKAFNIVSDKFSYSDTSMLSLAFGQSIHDLKSMLTDSSWQKISKAINFTVDSLLLPTNKYYQLDVTGIYPRTDSAISYTYDDNFNPIEKVTVNKVEEPVFNFTVTGENVINIYDYWSRNGQLEKNGDSSLFTPIPFAKSYCSLPSKNTLTVATNNYAATESNRSVNCMMFFRLLLTKVPPSVLSYLPPSITRLLKNIESVEAVMTAQKGQTILDIQFNKKKNDLPLVEF